MKFVFIRTGAIMETNNSMVIEQMKKSDAYKEYVEPKKEAPKKKVTKNSK